MWMPAALASRNSSTASRSQAEVGIRLELGDEVVVVRVEPLGHLQRRLIRAARHREVGLERAALGRRAGTARGTAPTMNGGVEHVVVEGEVVRWDVIDPASA